MTMIVIIVTAALCGLVHWLRGQYAGGLRFAVGGAAGAGAAFASADWIAGAMTAVGVLVFLLQPWGRWFSLGNRPRDLAGEPSWYEALIERAANMVKDRFSSDALAWWLSATLFVLPLATLVSPLWLVLPPVMIAIYAGFWSIDQRLPKQNPIPWSEAATGLLIGALAVLLAGCAAPERQPDWGGIAREIGNITR
jgi:hypothetical protein